MRQDEDTPFVAIDNLVIEKIASYLSLHSIYQLVCACYANSILRKIELLTPEWFIRRTFLPSDDLEVLPLDEESTEKFFLAETFPQMLKCRLIPNFCMSSNSCGIGQYLSDLLDVSPDSVYTEWMAMFLARLWYLAQRHAEGRSKDTKYSYPQILLWDFLHAARIMGCCGIPFHDQVFQLHSHLYETIVFVTTIEICHLVDPDAASRIEDMTLTDIRCLFQQIIESLLVESIDDDACQQIYSYLRTPYSNFLLDESDTEEEKWYMEGAMENLSFSEGEQMPYTDDSHCDVPDHVDDSHVRHFDALSDINMEHRQIIENLHEIHDEIAKYTLQDFGIHQMSTRLLSSSRRPPMMLLSRSLCQMGLPQQQKFTDSVIKFVLYLIEGIHFGSAIEVKVRKASLPKMIFDYGVIFDQNGTVWRGIVLSSDELESYHKVNDYDVHDDDDDESLPYEMENSSDEEYIPSDEEVARNPIF
jgi:hypothetical protein